MRDEFSTDLVYFGVGHVLIQLFVFLTVAPATAFFAWARYPQFQAAVRITAPLVQFVEIVLRLRSVLLLDAPLFHRVPFLWRVHAVHHSPRQMDWLAGSRLHVIEIVVVRAVMFLPLFVFGFAQAAVQAYVVFVAFHAVLLHANVRFRFGRRAADRDAALSPVPPRLGRRGAGQELRRALATARPHVWNAVPAAGRWPAHMGVSGAQPPPGFWAQLLYPFRGGEGLVQSAD